MHRENEELRDEQESAKGGPGCGPGRGPGRGELRQEQPDHLDQTAAQWEDAFFEALHEVRMESLKAHIKTAWGKNIDATAKEVVGAMLKEWQEFQKREEAEEKKGEEKGNARAALRDILKKGMRKGPQ